MSQIKFIGHGVVNTLMRFLLVQCHYSYSACGLGSDGTNRLVQLVQGMQHNKSKTDDGTLYGAKITGGGSGGTVCVIGRNSLRSSQQIIDVCIHTHTHTLGSRFTPLMVMKFWKCYRFSRDTKQRLGTCHWYSKVRHLELASLVTSGSGVVSLSDSFPLGLSLIWYIPFLFILATRFF